MTRRAPPAVPPPRMSSTATRQSRRSPSASTSAGRATTPRSTCSTATSTCWPATTMPTPARLAVRGSPGSTSCTWKRGSRPTSWSTAGGGMRCDYEIQISEVVPCGGDTIEQALPIAFLPFTDTCGTCDRRTTTTRSARSPAAPPRTWCTPSPRLRMSPSTSTSAAPLTTRSCTCSTAARPSSPATTTSTAALLAGPSCPTSRT